MAGKESKIYVSNFIKTLSSKQPCKRLHAFCKEIAFLVNIHLIIFTFPAKLQLCNPLCPKLKLLLKLKKKKILTFWIDLKSYPLYWIEKETCFIIYINNIFARRISVPLNGSIGPYTSFYRYTRTFLALATLPSLFDVDLSSREIHLPVSEWHDESNSQTILRRSRHGGAE